MANHQLSKTLSLVTAYSASFGSAMKTERSALFEAHFRLYQRRFRPVFFSAKQLTPQPNKAHNRCSSPPICFFSATAAALCIPAYHRLPHKVAMYIKGGTLQDSDLSHLESVFEFSIDYSSLRLRKIVTHHLARKLSRLGSREARGRASDGKGVAKFGLRRS